MDFLPYYTWIAVILVSAAGAWCVNYFIRGSLKSLEKKILAAYTERDYALVAEIAAANPTKPFSDSVKLAFARSLARISHYTEAVLVYHGLMARLLPKDSRLVPLLMEEADLHIRFSQPKKAEECYRVATEKEPANGDLAYKYAEFFYRVGANNRCLPILEHLIGGDEDNIPARSLLAEALASLGFYDRALGHYEYLSKYRRGIQTYYHAKTLKESGFPDRAFPIYQTLINSPAEPPYDGFDAPKWAEIWEKAVRDCVQIYLKKENGSEGGIVFIDRCLPKVSPAFSRELRLRKAEMYANIGADFIALEVLASVYREDENIPEARALVENWGKALLYPFLNEYFTPDAPRFERLIKNIQSPHLVILHQEAAYCYCVLGTVAYIFYRRIRPVPPEFMHQFNRDFHDQAPALTTMHLYSLNGLTPNAEASIDRSYFFSLHQGTEFLKEVAAAVSQERGTVKFPSDIIYENL